MPRRPDMPCADCGKLMWRGTGSQPPGTARCHPCRRANPTDSYARSFVRHEGTCTRCGTTFRAHRRAQPYCSRACANAANAERTRIRSIDDPHVRRAQRERRAPGLSIKARRRLLATWMRRGKACVYCASKADTIDHVVPLVRGGTNHEGNLTPCCRICNARKGGLTVIEWRTGLRLPPMWTTLATPKPKTCAACGQPFMTASSSHTYCSPSCRPNARPKHPCQVCGALTARLTCSTLCSKERHRRLMRDKYRASVGLPVDASAPSKQHAARFSRDPDHGRPASSPFSVSLRRAV